MLTIGLTYDLKDEYLAKGFSAEEAAEFDSAETINALAAAIEFCGFRTERIGSLANLMTRLLQGDRWSLVFNIAEGLRGPGRESEIPCLLESFQIPYTFSDPMVLALCLHKGMSKHVVRDQGVPTADFVLLDEADKLDDLPFPFPVFVKPVAEGTGKGVSPTSKVKTHSALKEAVACLLAKFHQPVLVEPFLAGAEYTVGILGTGMEAEVLGGMEILYGSGAEGDVYSYTNKAQYENRISYRPIDEGKRSKVYQLALEAYRGLLCRDGGRVDIRENESGEPQFLEINPLPGLHPIHSDLPILAQFAGVPYNELIRRILHSALKRVGNT